MFEKSQEDIILQSGLGQGIPSIPEKKAWNFLQLRCRYSEVCNALGEGHL